MTVTTETRPDTDSEAYRQAYGRVNGVVMVIAF